ncbi:unnamed protein product [Rhizoctonia solani]|uniref:Uncharacterized protein n=1 Tax=Rhizoctonia solani TaxID=456999 RepID=A0A8H3C896_9AGAM|nr:unnamed protein product [Rhizoctonia solani]
MTEVHPTWGRPIGHYSMSYTREALIQELGFKRMAAAQRGNLTLIDDQMTGIRVLNDIGKENDKEITNSMARSITLKNLRDALDMAWNKGMISFLSDPEIFQETRSRFSHLATNTNASAFVSPRFILPE